MKQSEIKTGESYLFTRTDVENRKFMEGTIVTVCSSKQRNKKPNIQSGIITGIGKKPKRFKLTNGHYANAANLQPLNKQS
jgi:hypothetical protein